MPDQEHAIDLIPGQTYRYTEELVMQPYVDDGNGHYIAFPIQHLQAGVTIGVLIGTDDHVRTHMSEQIKFIDVEHCALFRPPPELLQATELHFDTEFVLIPIPYSKMGPLEAVS